MASLHRKKNLIVLMTALVVGGLAAYAAQSYLRGKLDEIESRDKNKASIRLVVPKQNLEKGARLSAENLAVRAIPEEWAHSGGITPDQSNRIVGAVLAYPVNAGEPLLWAQMEAPRPPTFSTQLAPGRRAVTVPVDEISSVSGMLEPGDLIDIVVSLHKERSNFTFTLLQSVPVLATGQQTTVQKNAAGEAQEKTYTTITLDTLPEDAKRVIAAREIGRVTAMLRAPGDVTKVSAKRTEALSLLGLAGSASAGGFSPVPVIYGGGPIGDIERLKTSPGTPPETPGVR